MATLKVPVTSADHIQGNKDAKLVLVEYGDYECPGCGQAFPMVKRIQQHFGDKLKFVFRNFPLTEIHPHAEVAAETAEFAAAQQQFWEMHDLIYTYQQQLSIPMLIELVETLKLSAPDFKKALELGTYKKKIKDDFLGGVHSGVNGTPTFFINGVRYDGPLGLEDLVSYMEEQ